MKRSKRVMALALALILTVSLGLEAFAANGDGSTLSGFYNDFTGGVNLENEGTLDWAYWGHNAFNQKNSGPRSISDSVIFGGGDQAYLNDSQISYSWDSNGSVWSSSNNNTSGKYTNRGSVWQGGENGMYFTVPASENMKLLTVYGSYWGTKGEISATLENGELLFTQPIDTVTQVNKYYKTQIYFSSPTEDTLKFQIKITEPYSERWGSVSIHAATLQEVSEAVINLNGDSKMTVDQGTEFVDPGFLAVGEDGDISEKVIVSGSVDTSICGTYTIEYSLPIEYGGAVVTRTVTVVPPVPGITAIRAEDGSKTVKVTALPNSTVNLYDNMNELVAQGVANAQGEVIFDDNMISVSYTATQFSDNTESLMSEIAYFAPDLSLVPQPILDNHPEWVELYNAAWDMHKNSLTKTNSSTGFVNYYVDEMLDSNTIFQWDTIFMTFFNSYSNNEFPGMDSLDNFYRKQKESGYICRVLKESNGADDYGYTEQSWDSVNPPLFAYAEWNYFKISGDADRFTKMINGEQLIDRVAMLFRWIKANRRNADGTYWTNGQANGHDNIPVSWNPGTGWIDLISQQASSAYYLVKMAEVVGREDLVTEFTREYEELVELINEVHWDESEEFYHNTIVGTGFDNAGNNRTILGFWPMAVNAASEEQADALVNKYIMNASEFWRPSGMATVSQQSQYFDSTGDYWRGSIWAPTSYMTNMALNNYGYNNEAFQHAVHYINAMYEVYTQTKVPFTTYKKDGRTVNDADGRYKQTLWECYSSEYPQPATYNGSTRFVGPDFVGWTGAGPIAMLIEDVIGLKVNAYEDTLDWHLSLTERNGIENFTFGDNNITIFADERTSADEKAVITVETNSAFTLNVNIDGEWYQQEVAAGSSTFELGKNAAGKPAVLEVTGEDPGEISVDLTEEGTLDWIQFGQNNGTTVNRKATDTKYFSDYRYIGRADKIHGAGDSNFKFSWSDGETNETGAEVKSKMVNDLSGNGFEFDVPADQTLRTLKVYVSNYGIDSKFDVEISDGSFAHDVTMTDPGGSTNIYRVFTINYRATKPDQFLTVRFTGGAKLYDATWGSVCLIAATLSESEPTDPEPTESYILGNAYSIDNTDINLKDVLSIQKHVAGKVALTGADLYAANVDENKDEENNPIVDIKDALLLQKWVAKINIGDNNIGKTFYLD